MQNSQNNKFIFDRLTLAFIAFQVIFITAITTSLISQLNRSDKIEEGNYESQPYIHIDNFSETIPEFPPEYIDVTQALLLNIAQNNDPNINLSDAKAIIRDGAIYQQYFSLPNINYISAIIDIPAISQSYQLFLQYSGDEQNKYLNPNDLITFLCIKDTSYIIYPDFNCEDIYSQETRKVITYTYLPFFNFNQFNAGINSKNYSQVNIIPNNFDQVDENLFLEETRRAINSLGISPDLFDYYIYKPEDINYYIEF